MRAGVDRDLHYVSALKEHEYVRMDDRPAKSGHTLPGKEVGVHENSVPTELNPIDIGEPMAQAPAPQRALPERRLRHDSSQHRREEIDPRAARRWIWREAEMGHK